MTDRKSRADKIAGMSDEQMLRLHSKNLREIEAIVDEQIRRLDKAAGNDRQGDFARFTALARVLRGQLISYHSGQDALMVEVNGTPVPKTGEGRG